MGLAAAYQLALEGQAPVVFESDDRIGGMAASFDFAGHSLERYYHFHCTSDHAFLDLLGELGLADRMRWVETKMGFWYQGQIQPWGNPLALLRFRGLGLAAKIRYGLHAFLCVRRNDWHDLDHVEATGWIRRWVGNEAYEVLWRRLFEHKFHEFAQNLSAAWIWSRIRRIGRSRSSLLRERLGYLEGGSQTLLDALARDITTRGGEIRLRTPVRRIVLEGGAVSGIETPDSLERFDTAISTIPLPCIPGLIPELPVAIRRQYQSVNNIGVVCVVAKLRKPVSENFWLNTNDECMDIPGLVEYTNLRPLGGHIVYIPFYMPTTSPAYAAADETFLRKVRAYLTMINPSLADGDITDMAASRYRYAQPICTPGYLGGLPPVKLPVRGLFVADTSSYYPEDRGMSESIYFGRMMARMATGENQA